MHYHSKDTIAAPVTGSGNAAIAMIRLSGQDAIALAEKFFYNPKLEKKPLATIKSRQASLGLMIYDGIIVDEVLVTVFKSPGSYTGEDCVEITCHGSRYIVQQLLRLLLSAGARMAQPGEFTLRAFLNGKMDLSQAEAVSDLISSNSAVSHQVAMQQMRGGFSSRIKALREHLLNFASLIELELDFSEEDVEFADRTVLDDLVKSILAIINKLIESYDIGNVIRNGVPVAIVGRPNAGKSTLLNVLLEDERAIVSDIPGTTRDTIEDEMIIEGVLFRFIDTAGIRTTTDLIEQEGVNRALDAMKRSAMVIYLFDAHEMSYGDLSAELEILREHTGNSQVLLVANKADLENITDIQKEFSRLDEFLCISAREKININALKEKLVGLFDSRTLNVTDTIVTNARHAGHLRNAALNLERVRSGLANHVPGDLLALDLRQALNELGNITGEISGDDLLENIFSRFCIGK